MVTKDDLRDFQRFADAKLANGGAESLVKLAGEWEAQRREAEEAVADIRRGHLDIEAGRISSVSDAFASVRKQLGSR